MAALGCVWPSAAALECVPTNEESKTYRKSWNPLSNGSMFTSGVDAHPQGQFTFQPFIFSQVSEKRFGTRLTDNRSSVCVPLNQVTPVVMMASDLADHVELNVELSAWGVWLRLHRGGTRRTRSIRTSRSLTLGARAAPPSCGRPGVALPTLVTQERMDRPRDFVADSAEGRAALIRVLDRRGIVETPVK